MCKILLKERYIMEKLFLLRGFLKNSLQIMNDLKEHPILIDPGHREDGGDTELIWKMTREEIKHIYDKLGQELNSNVLDMRLKPKLKLE